MYNSNLPPGCSESDLPGNSAEDAAFDNYTSKLTAKDYADLYEEYCNRKGSEFDDWLWERFSRMGA